MTLREYPARRGNCQDPDHCVGFIYGNFCNVLYVDGRIDPLPRSRPVLETHARTCSSYYSYRVLFGALRYAQTDGMKRVNVAACRKQWTCMRLPRGISGAGL